MRALNTAAAGAVDGLDEVDPAEIYGADSRPPLDDRPWVLGNMIASVDGAATDPTGRSAGLGGPADLRVFSAIRAVADIVLAGAGTVRTERYGPARMLPAQEQARRARGQAPRPRIAVVTRSLALDLELPLFREATDEDRPIVITTTAGLDRVRSTGGATATQDLAMVAEIIVAGDESVDWARHCVRCAPPPAPASCSSKAAPASTPNWWRPTWSTSSASRSRPNWLAADGFRIVRGVGTEAPRRLTLDRVLLEDDYFFLRYLRVATAPTSLIASLRSSEATASTAERRRRDLPAGHSPTRPPG